MSLKEISPDALRHAAFPRDGRLRWLRWLDGIDVANASGTPAIQALLSLLPPGTDRQRLPTVAEAASLSAGSSVHPVHVGSLPSLRLGAVFLDGVQVGDLQMEPSGPQVFQHSDTASVVRADQENPLGRPSWWQMPWTVLPVSRYPLGRFSRSFCVQLQARSCHLLIPCAEIFRVLCAPESRLANALLSGPWDAVKDRVMNEAWNDKSDDAWQMGLRPGLTGRSAQAVAAYHWTVWGRQVASTLKSVVMEGGGWSHLQAAIPYRFTETVVEGEGFWLVDNVEIRRFLLLRITSVAFPKGVLDLPPVVIYRLDNYNTVRQPDGGDPPPPYVKHVPALGADPATGTVEVSSSEPPAASAEPAAAMYPVAEVKGLPETKRLDLEPPAPDGVRRRRLTRREPSGVASTAFRQRGGGDVASLSHSGGIPSALSPGYDVMVSMLDGLLRSGLIDSWMPTVPADAPWEIASGIEAWLLPAEVDGKRRSFARLRSGRRRTCFVAEISVSCRLIHLMELERQSAPSPSAAGEGFRFVLLEVGADKLEDAVTGLLRSVVLNGGTWPADAAGGRLVRLRHRYELDISDMSRRRVAPGWALGKIVGFLGSHPV